MKLLDTLNKYFGKQNITTLEKHHGVFRCEKRSPNNITYQVVFVDTTDKWCENDYSQYLESVVIDNYYHAEGFLQWNFYYYIITSKKLLSTNSVEKEKLKVMKHILVKLF